MQTSPCVRVEHYGAPQLFCFSPHKKWSHGELIRDGHDQTLTVDPAELKLLFQGMWDKDKAGNSYGQFPWRIGLLTPAVGR